MSTLLGLSDALLTRLNQLRSECMIRGLSPIDDSGEEAFVFQYFPETISSSKQVNYNNIDIPGGSLPIVQWISSGAHDISFAAVFSTDMDFLGAAQGLSAVSYEKLRSAGLERANPDLRTVVAYLRSFTLPTYSSTTTEQGRPITYGPRKIRLTLANSGIGLAGGYVPLTSETTHSVTCVMTSCDIEYQAFFPSGLPRLLVVNLAFTQVANVGGRVRWPQAYPSAAAVGLSPQDRGNRLTDGATRFGFRPYSITSREEKKIV